MKKLFSTFAVIAALFFPALALAQSSPGLYDGQVPTAIQWNSYFSAKQDALNFTPLNINGGTMTGEIVTTPSTTIVAGFNVPPGTAPNTPVNGDIWVTAAGIFVQINGATIGPLISADTSNCALFNASIKGCVASPGTPTGKILRDDNSWINPTSGGTVTHVGYTAGLGLVFGGTASPITGSGDFTVGLGPIAADSFWMNGTGSSAVPTAVAFPNCSILSYSTTTHSFSCGNNGVTSITFGTGLTGGTVVGTGTVTIDKAANSDIYGASSNKVLTADTVFGSAANFQSPTGCGTATVTLNFSNGFNFSCQLVSATNFTLANPSPTITSAMVGRGGCLYFVQPASGTVVTIAFGTTWFTAGGSTGKGLTAALNAQDRICYLIVTTTEIDFTLGNGIAH